MSEHDFLSASAAVAAAEALDVPTLELVYRLEVSGEVLYQGLADRVDDPEAKELLRRNGVEERGHARRIAKVLSLRTGTEWTPSDRKSTRLNSSHSSVSRMPSSA